MTLRAVALALLLAACGTAVGTPLPEATEPVPGAGTVVVGVQPPSGDRRVNGSGDITGVDPISVDLGAAIVWAVATPTADGLDVVAVLADGGTRWIELRGEETRVSDLGPPSPGPPVVSFGSSPSFITPDPESIAPPTAAGAAIWWTAADGSVYRGDRTVGVRGLPDGRIVVAADGSVAVLSGPTSAYPHGVLGDAIEAASVTVLEPDGTVRVEIQVDGVVEGLSPLWADLDADGRDELVVTVSDAREGARIVVYDGTGEIRAEGEPIGTGNRWRHQIGTVPDPHGATALVVVRTPHIGGVAEYWRLAGSDLVRFDTRSGITSHTIRSRNLDLAVVTDADGDATPELIAPTSDLLTLVGLVLTGDGIDESWRFELPARLSSNLHAIADGPLVWLIAGLDDGTLLVWPPVASAR